MVVLNEWLPNPVGVDHGGEWLELWNNGSNPVNLSGWRLASSAGGKFSLKHATIGARNYLVLRQPELKLSLGNRDQGLSLYNEVGRLVDAASFHGTAPEGKSFGRLPGGRSLSWLVPTPAAPNIFPQALEALAAVSATPFGQINPASRGFETSFFIIGLPLLLTGLLLYALKRDAHLSQLFFGRD